MITSGVERPAARLFSNPPGEYGSMVNEVVGSYDWEQGESLGKAVLLCSQRRRGWNYSRYSTVRVFDLYFKLDVGFESL